MFCPDLIEIEYIQDRKFSTLQYLFMSFKSVIQICLSQIIMHFMHILLKLCTFASIQICFELGRKHGQ
jgi:hypothetical protein